MWHCRLVGGVLLNSFHCWDMCKDTFFAGCSYVTYLEVYSPLSHSFTSRGWHRSIKKLVVEHTGLSTKAVVPNTSPQGPRVPRVHGSPRTWRFYVSLLISIPLVLFHLELTICLSVRPSFIPHLLIFENYFYWHISCF